MKTWGSEAIATSILKLSTRWRLIASCPGRFTPKERAHGTHLTVGWVDTGTGLEAVAKKKIPYNCRELIPGRPSRGLVTVTILTKLKL
jgi:hypothetical protein